MKRPRRMIISMLLSMLIIGALCGCNDESLTTKTDNVGGNIRKASYDGHDYILWTYGGFAGGMTHDPDCKCFVKE